MLFPCVEVMGATRETRMELVGPVEEVTVMLCELLYAHSV